ncbi:MAG: Neelaredoxin [Chloroflexi bacterium]|nr:Neelaredoxin [Chloroflexota bacterium]
MTSIGEKLQHADWKSEKHVPAIECPDTVKAGELFTVNVSVGKDIPHPNTVEHHISWISVYFLPDEAKNPYEVGTFTFAGHGQSAAGPNQGPVHCEPNVTARLKLTQSGTLYVLELCNIHGLWENSQRITVS